MCSLPEIVILYHVISCNHVISHIELNVLSAKILLSRIFRFVEK